MIENINLNHKTTEARSQKKSTILIIFVFSIITITLLSNAITFLLLNNSKNKIIEDLKQEIFIYQINIDNLEKKIIDLETELTSSYNSNPANITNHQDNGENGFTSSITDTIITRGNKMGAFWDKSLSSDGSFLLIDMLSRSGQCLQGKITLGQYEEFINYIKSTNILALQQDKPSRESIINSGIECDGSVSLFIRIDDIEKDFFSDCYSIHSENNESIQEITKEIFGKLNNLLKNNDQEVCNAGGYMRITEYQDGLCDRVEGVKVVNNLSELPEYLSKGIERKISYVYAGIINDQVKAWNKQIIKFNDSCFSIGLDQFDGENFDYYYDI